MRFKRLLVLLRNESIWRLLVKVVQSFVKTDVRATENEKKEEYIWKDIGLQRGSPFWC